METEGAFHEAYAWRQRLASEVCSLGLVGLGVFCAPVCIHNCVTLENSLIVCEFWQSLQKILSMFATIFCVSF